MPSESQLYIIIPMRFRNFLEETFGLVKVQRQSLVKATITAEGGEVPSQPASFYLELLGVKGSEQFKIEEWSCILHKSLADSEYGEELDSSLESIDMPSKSFRARLEETLSQLNPADSVKLREFDRLRFRLTQKEEDLLPMESENSLVREVGQHEGEDFKCELIVKYNYEGPQQLREEEEEFELLIDEEYERRKRAREERKLSQNLVYDRTEAVERLRRRERKEKGEKVRERLRETELPGRVLGELRQLLE